MPLRIHRTSTHMDLASLGSEASLCSLSAASSSSTATSPSIPKQEDEQLHFLSDGDMCHFCMSDIRGDVFMFQDKCYCSNLCRKYAVANSDSRLYQAAPNRL
mmetsp:Transcript_19852/g.27947  ORF Transcript_19852/g.27947 Transcript_19852/m.27947 type:complete len:102 (-) Transcript_19852:714-1019(-)